MITRFNGFIGPSYTSQSVNVDCQRTVNMFPEVNALSTGKAGEVASLVPTPGLTLLATLPHSPIRGSWTTSTGVLYTVHGVKLYKILSDWTYSEMGELLTSSGNVSLSDNGIHLVLVDGTYGYTCKLSDNTFARITDADFYAADQVTYQDGYFILNKANSNQWFISGLNDITFDPLDIASAEGSPDNVVGVISSNQNVYVFGAKSTEIYYNSGDADFPFARIQGAVLDFGCSAPFSIAKILGDCYFIGGDSLGSGVVYRIHGLQTQKISTPAIESVIRSLTSSQVASSTAFSYQQGGHLFYCLNLTGTKTTFVYDASTELWHERTYLNLWFLERHRAQCHSVAYGKNVVGDYESGKLYSLDPTCYTDNGIPIARIRTAPHITKDLKFITHNEFILDMETGTGTDGTGQGIDPQVVIRWSDDGGHTWSNEKQAASGKIGEYKKRVKFRRLGMSRDRVYEVKITDPVKVVLIGAQLDLEEGVS